ncbi:RagB/SusD family nutrient uptake outer membrane protein [Hymenobacter cellulosivorans]|uniref:RagB/SusD family nutrient uptake outer membrane protein n=1 Tax=Hymenobacter cellulosivorans TaxID=2932249 RepID=A0ABY4FEJ3_9BACT|nr:RagB/SusD family nutrient uptake outer membrane protein [Hymenobacter cellulosivorans]UOQ55024.1 RagB/SusD family nutrient uptake outer membrane protein [Hymenobacter cellulosivorans]
MKTLFSYKTALGLCAALLALGTTSCDKEKLSPIPTTLTPADVAFDNPSRVLLQVNNMYSWVKAGQFLGGRYQIFSDIRANDFLNRTSNGVTGLAVWNHTLTETSQNDVVNTWVAGYAAINQINVFLARLDENAAKFTTTPFPADYTATVTQYRAEGQLLRALTYYSLLQLYARPFTDGAGSKPGLPLRLQAEMDFGNNDLARSSVAEVYAQILKDLDFAEQNLPLSQTSALLNVTRAHRNTAIALKTRVYLSMGRYADVIREADKIVSATAPFTAPTGVRHTLTASVANVFAAPQETLESILSFPFSAQNQPGTQNQLAYYYLPAPLGNGEYSLNTGAGSTLANPAFKATDERRTSLVTVVNNVSYLRKYPNGAPYTDKAPVIRYAEVLLSLAEARFRTNGGADPQALALLNAVSQRSNGTLYTAFATSEAAVDAVLIERRIEFLGEGIRNIDIMRLNAPIPGKGSVSAVTPSDVLYVWPIPAAELATNKLMTRN